MQSLANFRISDQLEGGQSGVDVLVEDGDILPPREGFRRRCDTTYSPCETIPPLLHPWLYRMQVVYVYSG